ncbi:MAG TPA: hypothetical protein VGO11_17880, partial [Chthoniobacteraceae bacterium]|nr:hypothetical protein [Chthoniobacteraceae bacterium]
MASHLLLRLVLSSSMAMAVFAAVPTRAGVYYDYDVIAKTGDGGLTAINAGVSMNGAGTVAFTGKVAGGSAVFVGDGLGGPRNITPGFVNAERFFGPAAQINNANQVAVDDVYSDPSTAQYLTLERIWNGGSTNINSFAIVAGGGFPAGTYPNSYSVVLPYPTINNFGQLAFQASSLPSGAPPHSFLAMPKLPSGLNSVEVPNPAALRPMIDDDGRVVVRYGNDSTAPIRLYAPDLSTFTDLATVPGYFSELGRSPGISDDGKVIAFYGNLTASGAAALNAPTGPGLFVSVDDGTAARKLIRLNEPSPFSAFSAFSVDARVAVVHSPAGGAVHAGDVITVCFQATPISGAAGIWTMQGALSQGVARLEAVDMTLLPVVQVNDVIGGRTITGLATHDPLSDSSTVAFWASTTSGDMVVRARQVSPLPPIITKHRIAGDAFVPPSANDQIDAQLEIAPAAAILAKQPPLGLGVVADGVTPVLFKIASNASSPTTFKVTYSVEGVAGQVGALLAAKTGILPAGGAAWISASAFTVGAGKTTTYVSLSGIKAEELYFEAGHYEGTVTVNIEQASISLAKVTFKIRKPPIVLIHGYNSDGGAWSDDFKKELFRGDKFVNSIEYGVIRTYYLNRNRYGDPILQSEIKENTFRSLA